jgi:hypothetical protein
VRAVLPYKVLSKRQASFVLPEGLKIEPLVKGSHVLIDKDLQVGPRIISVLQKAVIRKVYTDILKERLGDNWKYTAGAVRIERGKLLIDRSSGAPDLMKKDEFKTDLQLLLDIGSDSVKVEFDLIRKTEGGISIGVGDVEFLVGSVDGRKSGIYVRGKLVRPALFSKPSSPVIPQKVTLIKGRTFAYVAVGKNTAECRISPANCCCESGCKRNYYWSWL